MFHGYVNLPEGDYYSPTWAMSWGLEDALPIPRVYAEADVNQQMAWAKVIGGYNFLLLDYIYIYNEWW